MSKPAYPDEKQEPVDGLDSDGTSTVNTITALVAEGENQLSLIPIAKPRAVH